MRVRSDKIYSGGAKKCNLHNLTQTLGSLFSCGFKLWRIWILLKWGGGYMNQESLLSVTETEHLPVVIAHLSVIAHRLTIAAKRPLFAFLRVRVLYSRLQRTWKLALHPVTFFVLIDLSLSIDNRLKTTNIYWKQIGHVSWLSNCRTVSDTFILTVCSERRPYYSRNIVSFVV